LHIHILGICGTFMGGLAVIARQLGYQVSGSDQNVYPPMSTQLQQQGIQLMDGYRAENLDGDPDLVIIGNALSRGNPEVEAVLNKGLNYVSGPQWLAEYVLQDKWVLGVAGTHGKTTTTSMLSWILEHQGFNPGFLIGGIPLNFGISARLAGGPENKSGFFVIEADEYDSAFFDKRSCLKKATAPIGNGWRIKPRMVAVKTANKCHACGFRPAGVGINQMISPTTMAISPFLRFLFMNFPPFSIWLNALGPVRP